MRRLTLARGPDLLLLPPRSPPTRRDLRPLRTCRCAARPDRELTGLCRLNRCAGRRLLSTLRARGAAGLLRRVLALPAPRSVDRTPTEADPAIPRGLQPFVDALLGLPHPRNASAAVQRSHGADPLRPHRRTQSSEPTRIQVGCLPRYGSALAKPLPPPGCQGHTPADGTCRAALRNRSSVQGPSGRTEGRIWSSVPRSFSAVQASWSEPRYLRQGPRIANTWPGSWTLPNRTLPSGAKLGPVISL